jgi:hypothetical protein
MVDTDRNRFPLTKLATFGVQLQQTCEVQVLWL